MIAHFPDGSVERVTVHENPEEGVLFLARDARWRITKMRMPERDEDRDDIAHEVDVELADE